MRQRQSTQMRGSITDRIDIGRVAVISSVGQRPDAPRIEDKNHATSHQSARFESLPNEASPWSSALKFQRFLPLLLIAAYSRPAEAAAPKIHYALVADHLEYSADRFLLTARGHAELTATDGTTMDGRLIIVDLKAHRILVAGHVHVYVGKTTLDGAAFSEFLDFNRSYFLPVENEPDRLTFLDGEYGRPLAGREMPGDAFSLPAETTDKPFLTGHRALIVFGQELRFGPAMLNTGIASIPVPNYFLTLSTNPNFAQNSLSGAHYDASYPFAGSSHSQTTLHIREDSTSGLFGAVEQRFAWEKSYIVGSIAPLDHEQKQYNVLGLQKISPTLQVSGFAQENAFQQGFSQPLSASAYFNTRATQALRGSYLQLNADQYYQSVLGDPHNACDCYDGPSHVFVTNHPVDLQLAWNGIDRKISHLPISYRLRSGFGYSHDIQGVVPLNGTNFGSGILPTSDATVPSLIGIGVPTITDSLLGFTLYTSALRIARDHHGNDLDFNAQLDKQRTAFSLPHHVDTTNTTLSLSKTFGTKGAVYLAYLINNTRDDYGAQQRLAYAPLVPTSPQTGATYPGFGAFEGFSTTRGVVESFIYTPNPNLNATLSFRQNTDFPSAVPGFFGQPPDSVTSEVRVRVRPHLLVDLSRSYYFNFGTQRWSPQFGILVGG